MLADRAVMRSWDRPNEDPICLTLSQEELARLVGLSRQTLNGLLQKLQDEGLIETSFRAIYVLDPAGLRQAPWGAPHSEALGDPPVKTTGWTVQER